MSTILKSREAVSTLEPSLQIKQELRQQITTTLQSAKQLPPDACLHEVRIRLLAIQAYCKHQQKTFIVVELSIACDEYQLGGNSHDRAVLFRGPNEDASVAICVTARGSLLYRNGNAWQIYKQAGDVNPTS